MNTVCAAQEQARSRSAVKVCKLNTCSELHTRQSLDRTMPFHERDSSQKSHM